MLADVSFVFFSKQPTFGLNIIKSDICAGIGFIAPHDYRKQETVFDSNIFEFDVGDIDSRLSLTGTFGIVGVEHASWTSSVWLFLLLRS